MIFCYAWNTLHYTHTLNEINDPKAIAQLAVEQLEDVNNDLES